MPTRPIKIELYRGTDWNDIGEVVTRWRWTARRGGRIINASTEAYTERIRAVDNIVLVFGIPMLRADLYGKRRTDDPWLTYRRLAGVDVWVTVR